MAGQLYNRQGGNLSTQVVTPPKQGLDITPITTPIIQRSLEIAAQNKKIAESLELDNAFNSAYAQAPDSPEQFSKLADSAISKFSENLTPRDRKDLQDKFVLKKLEYMAKVSDNYHKTQDARHAKLVGDSLNNKNIEYNLGLDEQYQGNINNDKNLETIGIQARINAQNNINRLANSKDSKGNYIYSEKERKLMLEGQSGHLEAAKRAIYGLSYDALKKWDEEKFQNRNRFKQDMGINDDTYDKMAKFIQERRKALKKDDERQIQAQTAFDTINYFNAGDSESLKKLKDEGMIDKDLYKSLVKTIDTPTSEFAGENARALADTLIYLNDSTNNFDPSVLGDPDLTYSTLKNFGKYFDRFVKDANLDDNQKHETINMLAKFLTDKKFGDAIKGIFDDELYTTYIHKKDRTLVPEYIQYERTMKNLKQTPMSYEEYSEQNKRKITQKYGEKEAQEKVAEKLANEVMRDYVVAAMSGDYDTANKIMQDGRKEIIMAANGDKISRSLFEQYEADIAAGRPAIWTHPITKENYEFCGFSNTDCIFKGSF